MERGEAGKARRGRSAFDLLLVLFLAFAFMFGVVRPFVAEVFLIPSESMVPTLKVGDSVLALKLAYRITDPQRGDVAVFRDPEGDLVIKRIVGLPGDTVAVRDGVLYVNGERKKESYVDYELTDSTFYGPDKVPPGHVYVMGDNRSNSRDSRDYGAVPEEDLLGRVVMKVAPVGEAGLLR
ncbi:MAG TPA: signal peptidase I [Rubrobacteraceae bacterium]|nr:signal peptidase I [Rubrobacteraceae bacterium]